MADRSRTADADAGRSRMIMLIARRFILGGSGRLTMAGTRRVMVAGTMRSTLEEGQVTCELTGTLVWLV